MNQVKQMHNVLAELEYSKQEPRLVKCLAVHNEADWVEFNLRNNYDEFDVIRVIEGAVSGRPNSTPDGHSTDNTLELIRNFPDPDNKIELITQDRFFRSLEEQKQTFLDLAQDGEWLFIVDCDEFYMEGDIARVREAIRRRPIASEFIPLFLHFYRDFGHVKAPHPEWQPQHQRIIRYRKHMRYRTHPVATDPMGYCTYFTPEYQLLRFTIPIYIYHYGHARGKEFHKMKREFYRSELTQHKLDDGSNAADKFDEKLVEFIEYLEPLDTILKYDGPHPAAIANHPTVTFRDDFYKDKEIKDWKEDVVYGANKLPTIALLMMKPWQKMHPVYNEMSI